ncbi:TPA: hypothetical protein ACP4LD_000698 [Escherichia coli]|uniref:hypothetical protein n=1 Tax=Escherichia coli TaxID=562 RepID=UPI0013C08EB2|nr:hypothetical protein [Escherichia coli]MDD8991059.1 hypothetical protein [Escherichia coli]MDD8994188.1 hypothetical protein [Escherichia coli]MDD9019339.1 hypothetical protein [Escherichia coli]MDD9034037.1 hypothetical protein [Escherichia coli]
MSIYFNKHGSAIGYQVEGRWLIKGDYLQIDQGPNIPEGLYKINDNKVKFPFDYKEVEGVIDAEKLTFTVCGIEYKMRKAKTNPWDV